MKRALFRRLSKLLVSLTGHGDDRSAATNNLHHKLSYRLFKLAPALGIRKQESIAIQAPAQFSLRYDARDGGVGHKLLVYGEYEPFTTEVVAALFRPGMNVWNIGANLGYYTLLASKMVGERGMVRAFEPHPANLAMLSQNVQLNGVQNVSIEPFALSDTTGAISFFESASNTGDHRITAEAGRSEIKVKSIEASEAIERFGSPAMIVMDVQGAEGQVLRSLKRALQQHRFGLIMEFWPDGLKASGSSAEEVEGLLGWIGYNVWKIDEPKKRLTKVHPGTIANSMKPGEEINLLCLPPNWELPEALVKLLDVR